MGISTKNSLTGRMRSNNQSSGVDPENEITGNITSDNQISGTNVVVSGAKGASIEFDWQGTELGVRQEGQSEYEYVDLKGDKGDTGSPGTTDYEEQLNKPQINGVTLVGNKSLNDLGIVNDKTYVHTQSTASDTWVVLHNLNKYPAVTVVDSAGTEVIGDIAYDSVNQLTITFTGAFKGKATLN